MNVIYVDKNDEEIGSGTIENATKKGIIVRTVRVFLLNNNQKLLIQKRSSTIIRAPNKWDLTAAGHVDKGETYKEAMYRELKEEMGIDNVDLIQLGKYYNEESEAGELKKCFNLLYVGTYEGRVAIDNEEVSEYDWVSLNDVFDDLMHFPDKYTNSFQTAMKQYNKLANATVI
jgi:isopentenyldiphosphate isomerase